MTKKDDQKKSDRKKSQVGGSLNACIIEGARAICAFIDRSQPTLMELIGRYDLQKRGIIYKRGGIWIANRQKLKKFWLGLLADDQKK